MNVARVPARRPLAVCAIALALAGLAGPASAAPLVRDDETPVVAPGPDGTNGKDDVPSSVTVDIPTEIQPYVVTVCDPNTTWYTATSATKSGKVTTWNLHIKNDSTLETFEFATTNTVSVGASASVTGTATASASIAKVAEASLGITTNYGLNGQYASTTSVKQTVTFNQPGKWVLWAGVYAGSGSVVQRRCASNGLSYSQVGTASASTFDKGRVDGLLNCANSASDLIEAAAKTKCG